MKTSVSNQDSFVPSDLYDMAARVASSHQITEAERCMLRKAILENSLNEEEHRLVNRLYRALKRGYLKLI